MPAKVCCYILLSYSYIKHEIFIGVLTFTLSKIILLKEIYLLCTSHVKYNSVNTDCNELNTK